MKWLCVGGPLDGQTRDDNNGPWTGWPGQFAVAGTHEGLDYEYQTGEHMGNAVLLFKQNGVTLKDSHDPA